MVVYNMMFHLNNPYNKCQTQCVKHDRNKFLNKADGNFFQADLSYQNTRKSGGCRGGEKPCIGMGQQQAHIQPVNR